MVGMVSYIAILEGLHLVTGGVYLRIAPFRIGIFSVAFGVSAAMPFPFGTNRSRFADAAGKLEGPLFAYEDLTAFSLEAAFLGVLLCGRKLVSPRAHFVAGSWSQAAGCSRRSGSWPRTESTSGRNPGYRRPRSSWGTVRKQARRPGGIARSAFPPQIGTTADRLLFRRS